ncbi:TIGR00730 family Rossman fold protein, partial [bacterium]|nr:TIGR00730 family Rossman fold protein [bacterium]
DIKFYNVAYEIGKKIAENGYSLIYGGSTCGCMGKVAQGVLDYGGSVTGIIPKTIIEKGVSSPQNAKIIISNDMNDRKQMMEEKADIFLALPGSFGTLDEIMQVIVTKQLSYHKKAIIFFDIDNYYKPLFNMFENFYQYGFAREFNRELYFITDRIDGIFEYCSQYEEKEFIFKY